MMKTSEPGPEPREEGWCCREAVDGDPHTGRVPAGKRAREAVDVGTHAPGSGRAVGDG